MSSHEEKTVDASRHEEFNIGSVEGVKGRRHQHLQQADYNEAGLKRELAPRQLAMISIGAAIGTGIFLGTGSALANGGPLGLLLGYVTMATVVISVLCCAGEMVSFLPISGGHLTLAARFVDPAFSAAASWNYWVCWCLVECAEISACAVLVGYWNDRINPGAWIAIFLVWILLVNIVSVRWFGEAEFVFTCLKLITITGLIITSIVITAGGGPNNTTIGFRFWRNPGTFVQYEGISGSKGRFLGWFAVLQQAAFSQIGSEMLALAAAETRNPRKALPLALKTVWIRISFFYILSVFSIGLIVSSDDPRLGSSGTAAASPFVIAISDAGIRVLPSVVNAAILSSALSAGCADLFTTSRALHSLARRGMAPAFFKKTTKYGIPLPAMLISWLMAFLSFLSINNGSSKAFSFFVNLTSISGVITWMVIAITYLRFHAGMTAQGLSRKETLPWKLPFDATWYMACWVVLIISIICLFSGWTSLRTWDPSSFFSTYTPIIWTALFFIGFKLYWRTPFIRADEMDFVTGIEEIEQDARDCDAQDELVKDAPIGQRIKHWWG
jgi:amino acid transporter